MVNNQQEFNEQYHSKKTKEIEFKRSIDFQGSLVIEGYLELEKLELRDNESIDKVILRNLPQLQESIIWNCNTKDLVIENCPQIKKLNVCKNLLTNLEFLNDLNNLELLEVEGNSELNQLTNILKNYQGNWKICKEILNLQKENQILKESKKKLKRAIQENVVEPLDEQLNEINKKIKRSSSFSQSGDTDELTTVAGQVVKNLKDINENLKNELDEVKTEIQILEEKLNQKQKEINYLNSQLQEQSGKILNAYQYCVTETAEKELLNELVKIHIEFTKFKERESGSSSFRKKRQDYQNSRQEIEENLEAMLKNRLGEDLKEEAMSKIEAILIECEKIVLQQLEM